MTSRWFSHSGDIGDILYSLPTIRAAGGGTLYLFDAPGRTSHGMTLEKAMTIKPLLLLQHYIVDVIFSHDPRDSDLNGFRDHWCSSRTLADMHLATHGFDWRSRIQQWLHVDAPRSVAPVIIHRSARYHNEGFPWKRIIERYQGGIVMVGTSTEHETFCKEFGPVPYYYTSDFLELARVIAGSKLFIGNQSAPEAVCEGLKHNKILEVHPPTSNCCCFQRLGAVYVGCEERLELPEI